LFVQNVWGYDAIKTGIAYMPMVVGMVVASGLAAQLVPRIGARPLLVAGTLITTGGMLWLSRLNDHSSYAGGLLGPMIVTAIGLGLVFVPISLVSLSKVANNDAGVASSLLNAGQQVGGSIGLAVLGTVAWSTFANNMRSQSAAAAAAAAKAGQHLSAAKEAALQATITDHAFAVAFSRGFLVAGGISLVALIITVLAIRVRREDLAGINPMAAPVD
jgi:MFS family permease